MPKLFFRTKNLSSDTKGHKFNKYNCNFMSEKPSSNPKFPLILLVSIGLTLVATLLYRSAPLVLLEPGGTIAAAEKTLLLKTTGWMLIVVIPVLIMTVAIAARYRKGNPKARYKPDWHSGVLAESLWWGIPCFIIAVLSVYTWIGSRDLDPFQPLRGEKEPMTIQVAALQWKWLFLYPEEGIASVNEVHFPENTPIRFIITADAPMNSFWIPKMGSQIYAMPGMRSEVNLIASEKGNFQGLSANLSGEGFAKMIFTAVSESESDFHTWVEKAKNSRDSLDFKNYEILAKPGESLPETYRLQEPDLFDRIINKFMMPDKK